MSSLPQSGLDLFPDLLLVRGEAGDDVRLNADLFQRVAPDLRFVEVQQTCLHKIFQVSIRRAGFGVYP